MIICAFVYAAWIASVLFAIESPIPFFFFINFSSDSPCLGLCRLDNVCLINHFSLDLFFLLISAVTVSSSVFFRLDNICFVCLSTCISNPISFLSFSAVTVRAFVYTSWITSVLFAVCSQSHFCFSNFSSDSTCLGLYHLDNVCFICRLFTIPFLF